MQQTREEKIKAFFEVISWLDNKRWTQSGNYNLLYWPYKKMKNVHPLSKSEKVLAHWLSYVTDRQMPFEQIWRKGGFIFSDMARHFVTQKMSATDIEKKFTVKHDNTLEFQSITSDPDTGNIMTFRSRYPRRDWNCIKHTLETLEKDYKRSIVVFVCEVLKQNEIREDPVKGIAFSLDMLTYRQNDKALRPILKPGTEEYEKGFKKWQKGSTENKKRLWCALRDYLKEGSEFHGYFLKAIKEEFPKESRRLQQRWKKLSANNMNELELPGDVWNNNETFKVNLVEQLRGEEGALRKNVSTAAIARELYETHRNLAQEVGFYPEQLDITFDFIPRMCSEPVWKDLCDGVCIFGENGAASLCINKMKDKRGKKCPVVFATCGYQAQCDPKGCPIVKEAVVGICSSSQR